MDTPTMKRLYKSRTARMIDGVCGGVAEYFGVDPTLVRIAWLLLAFMGGMGILLYFVAMILMPKNPDSVPPVAGDPAGKNSKFWGLLLVTVGAVWFLSNLGVSIWAHWWHLPWEIVFSVLLILAGVAFLMGGRNGLHGSVEHHAGAPEGSAIPPPPVSRLEKSRSDKKIFGVCGGIGRNMGVDPTIVRFAFVLGGFASFGLAVLMYVLLAIFLPKEEAFPATT
jgi:phage shock protein C